MEGAPIPEQYQRPTESREDSASLEPLERQLTAVSSSINDTHIKAKFEEEVERLFRHRARIEEIRQQDIEKEMASAKEQQVEEATARAVAGAQEDRGRVIMHGGSSEGFTKVRAAAQQSLNQARKDASPEDRELLPRTVPDSTINADTLNHSLERNSSEIESEATTLRRQFEAAAAMSDALFSQDSEVSLYRMRPLNEVNQGRRGIFGTRVPDQYLLEMRLENNLNRLRHSWRDIRRTLVEADQKGVPLTAADAVKAGLTSSLSSLNSYTSSGGRIPKPLLPEFDWTGV